MTTNHETASAQDNEPGYNVRLHSAYCPALGAFQPFDQYLPAYRQHQLTQFEWLPLYTIDGPAPAGWTLRAYYLPEDNDYYASHRTISEKIAKTAKLVELYAAPGAYGNDTAGHVPPKQK